MLGRADEPPYFVGGYGDYFLLPAGAVVYTVPDAVSDAVAAGANCALSQVMYGLERVDQQLGEFVVVQVRAHWACMRCGGQGAGAARVIAVDGVPERLELATAFGADAVIDINGVPTARTGQGGAQTHRRSGRRRRGRGSWPPSAIDEGLQMLGQFGRYVEIGNINIARPSNSIRPVRVRQQNDGRRLAVRSRRAVAGADVPCAATRHASLRPPCRSLYSLDDINEAFAAAEAKHDVRASIVP